MAIDIRANVTCSLGTLISGSISDDYIQGSGLVKTRGSVEINGIITPAIGTVVTFSYTKGGVTRTVPRRLRVMSSFADPYRRTTKVELGCKLTYFSDLQEPLNWDALDDPENAGLTADDQRIVTIPLYAKSIAAKCCEELGLDPAPVSVLTNKFSIAEFDFSPGYVQILGDLLVSESWLGYLNQSEQLVLVRLDQDGGTGPALTQADIVDLGSIGVGQLPGESVIVEYSTLKLRSPNESLSNANEQVLWEYGESVSISEYVVRWEDYITNAEYINLYKAPTYTFVQTRYVNIDGRDLVKEKITFEQVPAVAVAGAAASQYFRYRLPFYPAAPAFRRVVESYIYDDRGEIEQAETIRAVSVLEYAGMLNVTFADEESSIELPTGTGWFDVDYDPFGSLDITSYYAGLVEVERTVTTQSQESLNSFTRLSSSADPYGSYATRTTTTARGIPYTRQQTDTYKAWGLTIAGQQSVAASNASATADASSAFVNLSIDLGLVKTDTTIDAAIKLTPEGRPPLSELLNGETAADTGDPSNGWRTEATAETVLALGSAEAQRRITFRLPYAPDDTFSGPTGGPFTATASDADQKAITYGRVQNRLLLGNRSGMNLQLAPEKLPAAPFAPMYVQANGLTAMYRANGNQWAFSSDGIACSTDALFWAAVAGTGTYWFPVAPGVTTLPSTPPTGTGVISPGDPAVPTITPTAPIVPAYNEIVPLTLRTRTVLDVTPLDYALTTETSITLETRTVIAAASVLLLEVPAATVSLAAHAPTWGTSVFLRPPAEAIALVAHEPSISASLGIDVPAAVVDLAGAAPSISLGVAVQSPAASLTIAALVPLIGNPVAMESPAAELTLAAAVPSVSIGVAVSVPVATLSVAAHAPLDFNAARYIGAVEAVDGQALENEVRSAINDFYEGLKADGIYGDISAACLLMGARTRAGSYIDIKTATQVLTSNNFVDADYNRSTGLIGNASSKYLDTNTPHDTTAQNDVHCSVYVTTNYSSGTRFNIGVTSGSRSNIGRDLTTPVSTWVVHDTGSSVPRFTEGSSGFKGLSRDNSSNYVRRDGGSSTTVTRTASATAPGSLDWAVFCRRASSDAPEFYSDARLTWFSVGSALNLSQLDSRVTTLVTAIQGIV